MAIKKTNSKQSLTDSLQFGNDCIISFPGVDLTEEICQTLGAKGKVLYCMSQVNLEVPKTVVVPSTLTSENTDWHKLAKIILNQYFPSSEKLIVRSSADVEDGIHASFAGQFLSLECSAELSSVAHALEEVYRSANSLKVTEYSQNLKIKEIKMSLLVQEFIPAQFSGVAFSEHPVKPRKNEKYVEWTYGQLSSLVDGKVTPNCFLISENSNKTELPIVKQNILIENIIRDRLDKIEKLLNSKVDMEWLVDQNGSFWVLQARPLTHKHNAKISYLTGDNIGENYPEAVVPFLSSLAKKSYYHYFRSLGKSYGFSQSLIEEKDHIFRSILAIKNGRLSYNLFAINALLLHAPFGATLCKQFKKFIGSEDRDELDAESVINNFQEKFKSKIKNIFSFLKMLTFFGPQLFKLGNGIDQFKILVNTSTENCNRAIKLNSLEVLYRAYVEILNIRYFKWSYPAFADSICMIFGSLLPQTEIQSIKVAPSPVGHELNRLISLIKSDPKTLLLFKTETSENIKFKLKHVNSKIFYQLKKYCENWGFRRPGELLLVKPDYLENPVPLIEVIQLRLQQTEINQPTLIPNVFKKKSLYLKTIGLIYSFGVNKRESARLHQAKLYNNLRKTLLALGGLLKNQSIIDSGEDVFFLTVDEVGDVLAGTSWEWKELKNLIRIRKNSYQDQLGMESVFPVIRYENLKEDVESKATFKILPQEQDVDVSTEDLWGTGASAGTAKAPAKIVTDPSQINSPAIVVTSHTDPAWILFLPLIKGLIVEKGGILSHAAIVSREFGIPTIVGVPDAMKKIRDGQEIEINGENGRIRFI